MSLLKDIAISAAVGAVYKANEIKKDIEQNGLDFIRCPHCGTYIRVNAGNEIVYCSKCNSRVVVSDVKNSQVTSRANYQNNDRPIMRFCANCGNKLDPQSRFCSACGAPINGFASESVTNNYESQVKAESEVITTCPSCGGPINSFSPVCPHCGREIRQQSYATACQDLCRRLDEIERTRSNKKLVTVLSDVVSKSNYSLISTDKQLLEAINGFIVPNKKDDIIEFLLLAKSRTTLPGPIYDFYELKSIHALYNAWVSKEKQIIEKADLFLSSDSDYLKIRNEAMKQIYRIEGRCQHCGGKFKGLITQVCSECGQKKDYESYGFSNL